MELWPVYINIRVNVNSNIDAELTAAGRNPEEIRKVYRDAADSIQTRVMAEEVEGYKFFGWYKEIPAGQLTDDISVIKTLFPLWLSNTVFLKTTYNIV